MKQDEHDFGKVKLLSTKLADHGHKLVNDHECTMLDYVMAETHILSSLAVIVGVPLHKLLSAIIVAYADYEKKDRELKKGD